MTRRVAVIGAGMGGLAAAIDLARAGCDVQLFESAAVPGGKAHRLIVSDACEGIDAGPTVFTFREVFEQLFADAGTSLEREISLYSTPILARHLWRDGGQLDLMADRQESAARIADFANPKSAQEYLEFCAECARIHQALRDSFMSQPLQGSGRFMWRLLQDQQRLQHLLSMWRAPPWQSLWSALGQRFTDPRLRQLFARYATYVGSSPLAAPATLMLIAHVEQEGVWLIQGGMQQLAIAMGRVAERCGAKTHYQTTVKKILVERGQVCGLETTAGDAIQCDAVIFNGDAQALATGLLGDDARMSARAITRTKRGLSAITWCRYARTQGVGLAYHNVFFANDYPKEFSDIFESRHVTDIPTVYLCAQDRGLGAPPDGAERMLLLVNAPADGDRGGINEGELERIETNVTQLLAQCGLTIDPGPCTITRPQDFAQRFPASGGSLYGQANHGPWASFNRPSSSTRIGGLYLAGGSTHPGPGVPMATLSGRLAAAEYLGRRHNLI